MVGSAGLVGSLLLLAIGRGQVVPIVLLVAWGIAYGIAQPGQLTMARAAAPETFEAATSLNTMAYNTLLVVLGSARTATTPG